MALPLSFRDFMTVDPLGTPVMGAPDYDSDGYLAWLAQKRRREISGGPALAEDVALLEAESTKSKLFAAQGTTKPIAEKLMTLRKTPIESLKAQADNLVKIHSARSKQEYIDLIISSLFNKKALAAHDEYFWSTTKTEDVITEALTAQQRIKRRIQMKRIAPKIKLGKERAARRHANQGALQKRSIALARGLMAKKLLAGKAKGDVSFAERVRVEKIIAKRGATIKRIAAKLLPFLRKRESSKFSDAPATSGGASPAVP